jgi:hypothetical protein
LRNISKSSDKLIAIDDAWLKNQIKTYEFIEENQFKDFSSVANYKDLYSFKRDAYNDASGVKRDQIIV